MSTHGKVDVLPADEHNQKLVENVHPSTWKNPAPDGIYNLVAIGAGERTNEISVAMAAGMGL